MKTSLNGFIGGSYNFGDKLFDCQRCVNFYKVINEYQTSTDQVNFMLVPTPGAHLLKNISSKVTTPPGIARENVQTLFSSTSGRLFSVVKNTLIEILRDYTIKEIGTLDLTASSFKINENGQELIVVGGGRGHILDYKSGTFKEIVSDGFLGSDSVAFLNSRFM